MFDQDVERISFLRENLTIIRKAAKKAGYHPTCINQWINTGYVPKRENVMEVAMHLTPEMQAEFISVCGFVTDPIKHKAVGLFLDHQEYIVDKLAKVDKSYSDLLSLTLLVQRALAKLIRQQITNTMKAVA